MRFSQSKLRTSPLTYAILYFVLIPVFATIYWKMPNSFYAPYAKLEAESARDAYEIGKLFETAISRAIIHDTSEPKPTWIYRPDLANVSHFLSPDGHSFQFRLLLGFQTKDGLVQFSARGSVNNDDQMVSQEGDGPAVYSRFIELDTDNLLDKFLGPHGVKKAELLPRLQKLDFDSGEERRIQEYLAGALGDPTAVSGSWWRMLYFSAIAITTVGFGDIVPITNTARLFAAAEAVIGIALAGFFLNAVASRRAS